ncbi:nickel ABC transporter substrate-binding protein [Helicobacter baculiformis]|uniref:Nickel ABC transporter substrate-binding protein n=1 Tax=Helicobacter baculiformis TaxID=427351 RepID=A0ABV7ZIH3_9HELI|nr:nickel ABC transporter substrate-binding protein [Helicobacter baculiformis]
MLRKIFMAVAFCACASGSALNFATSKNVGPLNPHLYSPNEMFAQNMLYESLTKYDEKGNVQPHLAKSWHIENNGKRYIFKLRNDVYFSDGSKFDAQAAKANFDAVLSNIDRHKWLELANILVSCEVIDPYTIALNLKNAYEPTLKELSLIRPFRFVSPRALINGQSKDGIKEAVGTGPFKLESSKLGVSDTFVKNEHYWGQKAHYDKIVGKVIPNPNTKIVALKTGEIDLIYLSEQIPLDTLHDLKKTFNVSLSEPTNTLVIALNSNKFPTSDLSVRKALNMALNKDLITKSVFFDTQKPAYFLFSKNLPHCNIDAKAFPFDLKAANALLQKDGWILHKDGYRYKNGKKLSLDFVYEGSNAIFKSIAEIAQATFKKLGAQLQLKASESSMFYKKQKSGDFHLVFNRTWGIPYDPEMFLASMRVPSHADYQAQSGLALKNVIDSKISKMLTTFNPQEKDALIKSVLTTLHKEAVYIPISYETNIAISNKKVGGVRALNLPNIIPFEQMYPKH